jgi:hypothetical protein
MLGKIFATGAKSTGMCLAGPLVLDEIIGTFFLAAFCVGLRCHLPQRRQLTDVFNTMMGKARRPNVGSMAKCNSFPFAVGKS